MKKSLYGETDKQVLLAVFMWERFGPDDEMTWAEVHSKDEWLMLAADALARIAD